MLPSLNFQVLEDFKLLAKNITNGCLEYTTTNWIEKSLFLIILLSIKSFSQNIHIEITDYLKKIDDKEYSTYQFVSASYSHSRPTIVLVASKDGFMKLYHEIPSLYKAKQEYTDVYLLGIENFDLNKLTETDKKILDAFYDSIIKYRNDNGLPVIKKESINGLTNFIVNNESLYKYFSCRNIKNRKK